MIACFVYVDLLTHAIPCRPRHRLGAGGLKSDYHAVLAIFGQITDWGYRSGYSICSPVNSEA